MSDDERAPSGWHLKKEIQVTHLISTVVLGVSALVYVGDMKKDIEILKDQRTAQRDRDAQQDRITAEAIGLLREQLKAMDAKLDRLIEARRN